jgi:hypothetical protein
MRVGSAAEPGGNTTRATGWGLPTRTANSPAGTRPGRSLRGARWRGRAASTRPVRGVQGTGAASDPRRRRRRATAARRRRALGGQLEGSGSTSRGRRGPRLRHSGTRPRRSGTRLRRSGTRLQRSGILLRHNSTRLRRSGIRLQRSVTRLQRSGTRPRHSGIRLRHSSSNLPRECPRRAMAVAPAAPAAVADRAALAVATARAEAVPTAADTADLRRDRRVFAPGAKTPGDRRLRPRGPEGFGASVGDGVRLGTESSVPAFSRSLAGTKGGNC